MKAVRSFVCCLCLGMSALALGDVIELKNGDRLQGSLIEVTDSKVIWKSDTLGEVFLPAEEVVDLARYQALQQSREPEEPQWKNSGSVSISGRKENKEEDKEEWDVDIKTTYEKDVHRHTVEAAYESDRDDMDHVQEEYLLGYEYNWFFQPKWFMKYTLEAERNEAKNLEEQYTAGVGLGYQFWSTELHHLEVGGGINYVNKNFFVQDPDQQAEYAAGSWNLDWWYKPAPQWRLFHEHDLLLSMKRLSDYQLETETGARYLFSTDLFAELRYEWDYDSTPKVADKEQSTWVLGIGYDW